MTRGECAAGLALLLSAGWTAWDATRIGREQAAPLAEAHPVRPAAEEASDDFQIVTDRSLFAPDRRGVAGAAGASALGGLILRGTVAGAGGAMALFEPVGGGPGRRLPMGATVGGYRIAAIEEASILLDRGGRTRRLAIDQIGPAETIDGTAPDRTARPPATSVAADGEVLPVIRVPDAEGQDGQP